MHQPLNDFIEDRRIYRIFLKLSLTNTYNKSSLFEQIKMVGDTWPGHLKLISYFACREIPLVQ